MTAIIVQNSLLVVSSRPFSTDDYLLTNKYMGIYGEPKIYFPFIESSLILEQGKTHITYAQDSTQAQSSDNVDIIQHYIVAMQDAVHLQNSENVDIEAYPPYGTLSVKNTTQTQKSGVISLAQNYSLTINNAIQLQFVQSVEISINFALIIQGTTELQTADNLDLYAYFVISQIDNITHLQYSDNVVLIQGGILAVGNSTHTQLSEKVYFPEQFILEINDSFHMQYASEIARPSYPFPISYRYRKVLVEAENRIYIIGKENRIIFVERGDKNEHELWDI